MDVRVFTYVRPLRIPRLLAPPRWRFVSLGSVLVVFTKLMFARKFARVFSDLRGLPLRREAVLLWIAVGEIDGVRAHIYARSPRTPRLLASPRGRFLSGRSLRIFLCARICVHFLAASANSTAAGSSAWTAFR